MSGTISSETSKKNWEYGIDDWLTSVKTFNGSALTDEQCAMSSRATKDNGDD
ncbi:MAG: hypothetical protein F6K36_19275 [Symploca sp. SIO3C6]|nr:hypothetical protein [Symploca sp. SIO3C6]